MPKNILEQAQQSCYIIAELSANHLGQFERARETLEAAAECGVDAVKLQTYRAGSITLDHDGPGFKIESGLWQGTTLYELYRAAQMPWEWHKPLMRRGSELGVHVFSSPFDYDAIELLASLDVPAYKIASFEAIDLPLIERAAAQAKPLIISTGMANLAEIDAAVHSAERGGAPAVSLLHCISGYPTPVGEANLRTIPDLARRFPNAVIGLSDHTLGTTVSVASIVLGASIIEKHFTLARADGGPDSSFSLEPRELQQLVQDCRVAWEALGETSYELKSSERNNVQFRRSLYAIKDIAEGEAFTEANIRSIRPGFGLPPKQLHEILGKTATKDIKRGEPLQQVMISR